MKSHRSPSSKLTLTAIALMTTGQMGYGAGTPDDQQYAPNIKVSELATTNSKATIELVNSSTFEDKLPSRLTRHFWVAGYGNSTVTMTVKDAEWYVLDSDSDLKDTLTSMDGDLSMLEGPFDLESGLEWGGFPEEMLNITVRYQDAFRGVGMYRSEVITNRTIGYQPGGDEPRRNGILILKRIVLEADLGAPPEGSETFSDPYMTKILGNTVVNASQLPILSRSLPEMERKAELDEWNDMLAAAEERGPLLFAKLPKGGVYRLTAEELREAGISPESIPVSRLRLYAGSHELMPMEVSIQRDRILGKGALYFYVPEYLGNLKPYIPLWVFVGETEREDRSTSTLRRANAPEDNRKPVLQKITIFEPNEYNHMLPQRAPNLKWATAELGPVGFKEFSFEVSEPAPDQTAKVSIWVSTTQSRHESVHTLYINGVEIAENKARGRQLSAETFEFDSNLLKPGTNVFALRNNDNQSSSGSSLAFLSAELTIPTQSSAIPFGKPFSVSYSEDENQGLALPWIEEQNHYIADISDPFKPDYTGINFITRDGKKMGNVIFESETLKKDLIYFTEGMSRRPLLRPVSAPRSHRDRDQADLMVIYHEDLKVPVKKLIADRQNTRAVLGYDIQDLYNAYSYGFVEYQAIHDAISHALRHRDGNPLSQVLLVGEGSEYWWEYTKPEREVSRNMVPVYGWADSSQQIRGDDGYAQLSGDGGIPDIEIGRYSVETPEELELIFQKVHSYETNPPVGNWMNRHLFVMDDEPEFLRVAKDLIAKSFFGANIPEIFALQHFPYEDYFRGIWRKRSVVVTDRLVEEWNKGASTITYLGHGGPNLWSGERILHIRDIDRIDTKGRFPVLAAGSCDTGWIDYPVDPVRTSLAEYMVKSPKGGAVATYIPISGTSSYMHNFLLTEFYRAMFDQPEEDLGSFALRSKINFFLYNQNVSVTEQFLLIGDPALRMAVGGEELQLRLSPATLTSVTGGTLRIDGYTEDIPNGMADITILSRQSAQVLRERVTVENGSFSTNVTIPPYMEAGTYQVVVSAQNEFEAAFSKAMAKLTIVPTNVDVSWTVEPDVSQALPAGTPIKMTYQLANNSPLPLSEAFLEIWDDERSDLLAAQQISIPAGEKLARTVEIPMPVGVNSFRAELFLRKDEGNQRSTLSLGSAKLVTRGLPPESQASSAGILNFSLSEITASRLEEDKGTRLSLPVYKMMNVDFTNLEGQLRLAQPEGPILSDRISFAGLNEAEMLPIDLELSRAFEAVKTTFVMEILGPGREDQESSKTVQLIPFVHDFSKGADLEIVDRKLTIEEANPKGGKTVFVRFDVRNNGREPIRNVVAELFLNHPWNLDDKANNAVPWAEDNKVDVLQPGEVHSFRMRWDHQGSQGGRYTLYGTVKSTEEGKEVDLSNNVASLPITLQTAPNLVLDREGFTTSQDYIKPYDRVLVTIPFSNQSSQDFTRMFRITSFAHSYDGSKRLIQRQYYPSLEAQESGSIAFEWQVQPGEYRVTADVNEDREYLEETFNDNSGEIALNYIFDGRTLMGTDRVLDFASLMPYSMPLGLDVFPGNRHSVVSRPRDISIPLSFSRTNIIEGEIGDDMAIDNLFGLRREKDLVLNFDEDPEPVTWRYELPEDDGTTIYDIYIGHVGDSDPSRMSGHFNYQFNDEPWQTNTGGWNVRTYLGRIDTRDDFLRFTMASPGYPAFNHIWSFRAYPVLGLLEGPMVEMTSFPEGNVLIDGTTPGLSSLRAEFRFGRGDMRNVDWTDWQLVSSGSPMPKAPTNDGFLQWRVRLIPNGEDQPEFSGLRIEPLKSEPSSGNIAGLTDAKADEGGE